MRGRPGCPTGQKKNSVGATGGSPLFLLLQGKVGYRIAPSSDPASPAHLPPKGKALSCAAPSRLQNHPLPARPAGGRAVTGVRYRAAGQAEKKRGPPQGPPNQKRWVQGGRTSSSLVFFPPAFFQRKPGPRPGPGGQRGAAPRGRNEPRTWRVRSTAPHPHPAGSNLRRSQKGPPTDSRGPRPHLGPLGPPNVFGDIRQRPGDLHLIPPALGQVP